MVPDFQQLTVWWQRQKVIIQSDKCQAELSWGVGGRVPGGFLEVEALELSFEARRGGHMELEWWCGIGQCSGLGGRVQGVTPECTKDVSIYLLRMGQSPWSMMEVPPGSGVLGNRLCLFHGQRSLAGYSPWGHRESDSTE